LAAEAADGVVLNWVRPDDLERIAPVPEDRSRISLVIPVCPTAARDEMEQVMRPVIADYLHAPAYARQQTTLGRGELLEPMWRAWSTGGRKAARAAVPSAILDDLVIWGDVAACRQRVADIERATGVRVIATFFPPRGVTYSEVALSETRQLQRTRGGSPTHDSRDR
jgi:alkanesulfonate monooxygenase SsuD/methylene tetrahydromethanopterin reductase-like flavin-dependent oxidoreductase (luciferase family)